MRQIITKDLASIYTDVPTLRPGTVEAYALAFASAGVATVVRLAIDPYVMGAECLPFFPAVIITALIGGRGAGLFCVVLSTAAVVFLQMPPLTLLLLSCWQFLSCSSLHGCALQSSGSRRRKQYRRAKIVCSLPSTQLCSGGGSTIRSVASSGWILA